MTLAYPLCVLVVCLSLLFLVCDLPNAKWLFPQRLRLYSHEDAEDGDRDGLPPLINRKRRFRELSGFIFTFLGLPEEDPYDLMHPMGSLRC